MELLPEISMKKTRLPFAFFQGKVLEVQESKDVLAVTPPSSPVPDRRSPVFSPRSWSTVGIAAPSHCYSQRLQSNADRSPVQTSTNPLLLMCLCC